MQRRPYDDENDDRADQETKHVVVCDALYDAVLDRLERSMLAPPGSHVVHAGGRFWVVHNGGKT